MPNRDEASTPTPLPAFGARLRALREAARLSQGELAARCSMAPANVARIEQGLRPDPQWSTVCRLAEGLGVSVEEFRDWKKVKKKA